MADLTVPCAATVAGAQVPGHVTLTSDRLRWRPDAASATGEKSAALVSITAHQRNKAGAAKPSLRLVLGGDPPGAKAAAKAKAAKPKPPAMVLTFALESDRDALSDELKSRLAVVAARRAPASNLTSLARASDSAATLAARAALLKANPELAALHATLVKKGKGGGGKTTGEGGAADDGLEDDDGIRGAVTEEQFWAEREHLFDAAVAKKGAAQVAGVSNALDGDVKGTRDGRTDTVSCALSNEKMHRIFAERPAVRRAFLDNVPSKMTEVRPIHWSPYDGVGVVNAVP